MYRIHESTDRKPVCSDRPEKKTEPLNSVFAALDPVRQPFQGHYSLAPTWWLCSLFLTFSWVVSPDPPPAHAKSPSLPPYLSPACES